MTRLQIRNLVRSWFGLPPAPPPGSRADRAARRAARLQRDAERWAKHEAADRADRAFDRLVDSERLRVELEQRGGVKFPWE